MKNPQSNSRIFSRWFAELGKCLSLIGVACDVEQACWMTVEYLPDLPDCFPSGGVRPGSHRIFFLCFLIFYPHFRSVVVAS